MRVSSQEICWYVAHYTREGRNRGPLFLPPGVSVGRSLSKVRCLKDIVNCWILRLRSLKADSQEGMKTLERCTILVGWLGDIYGSQYTE